MPLIRKPPLDNVRRVQTNGSNLRYTLTNKAGRLVQCESQQERKLALLLERDQTICDYGSQPERLRWQDEAGQQHTYVPDFIVWRLDGRVELHEVTLTHRQSQPQQQNRQHAAHRICEERGWTYWLHTEKTLPDDTVTANLLFLYAYRSRNFAHPRVKTTAVEYLHTQRLPFCKLVLQLEAALKLPPPILHMSVLHLLWHDILETDLTRLLVHNGKLLSQIQIGFKGDML